MQPPALTPPPLSFHKLWLVAIFCFVLLIGRAFFTKNYKAEVNMYSLRHKKMLFLIYNEPTNGISAEQQIQTNLVFGSLMQAKDADKWWEQTPCYENLF